MIKDNNVNGFGVTVKKTYANMGSEGLHLLKKRVKQNRFYFFIITMMLLIGMSLAVFQPGLGYEIVVNDHHIGFTKDPADIRNVLSSLDSDLREAKGENIKYDMDIRFVKGRLGKNKLVNTDDLKIMVSSILSIRKPAYILKTEDGIAFAIDSKESVSNILDAVKRPYMEGKRNAKAEIVSEVSLVESQNIPVDKILNYNQAMSYVTNQRTGVAPKFKVKVTYNQTSTQVVRRQVQTIEDSSMYEGESAIKTAGSDGTKSVESAITEINGELLSTEVISEKILEAPVDKVILVGTKPKIPGVLQIAYQYLGVPYVWGGTTPRGFDCSGFVQYVYAQRGVYLPRTTYAQVNVGTRVSRSQLQPGDLCHFPGHVGIYVGGGQMIHAPKPGDYVRIGSVDTRNFLFGTRVE